MPHELTVGNTGSGKTERALREIKKLARRTDLALVILDPQKDSLARKALSMLLAMGLEKRIVYVALGDPACKFAWQLLERSTHPDPVIRAMENEQRARAFADVLCRRRGMQGLQNTPLIEEITLLVTNLWQYQSDPVPLSWLLYAFLPNTAQFRQMVENCTHELTKHQMLALLELSERSLVAFDNKVQSAKRLIYGTLMATAVQLRIDGAADIHKLLDEKYILIFEGDPNIGRDATRTLIGSVQMIVFQHAKPGAGGVVMYTDEIDANQLVGPYECQALMETRKYNLSYRPLSQTIKLTDPDCKRDFLNNIPNKVVMRLGDYETAMSMAEIFGVIALDFHKVHHTERTEKALPDGYDEIATKTKSKSKDDDGREREGTSEGKTYRRRDKIVTDEKQHYWQSRDQLLKVAQDFLKMRPGEFCLAESTSNGVVVHPVSYEPMERIWGGFGILARHKTEEAIARLWTSPLFQTQVKSEPSTPAPPATAKRGGAAQRFGGGNSTSS